MKHVHCEKAWQVFWQLVNPTWRQVMPRSFNVKIQTWPTDSERNVFFNVYYYSRYLTTLTCGSKEWPPKSELQRRRKLYVQAQKIKWKWNLKLLPERNLPSPKSEQIQCRRTCSGPPRSINSTCGILPTLLNPIFYECVISAIFVNFLTSSRMFENYFFC